MNLGVPPMGASGAQQILVVDDDPDILHVVRRPLEEEGFEVATAASARQAFAWFERNGLPHLAIVDIMMPEVSGLELCRQIQEYADLPVIMLTAVDEVSTVVNTIREVAEDYVTKPFNPHELAARAGRVIRRMGDYAYSMAPLVRVDDRLAIDFVRQTAYLDGSAVALTPTETKLLHVVLRSARHPLTLDYLLRRVWPLDEVYEDRLRVLIYRLRHKIEPDPAMPRYLITQRGVGYSFLPAA